MRKLCPACNTDNASDATVCTLCAAALPPPPSAPQPQRLSLLEQAMAHSDAGPFSKPATPPAIAAEPAPQEAEQPAPAAIDRAAPAVAKAPYTMPPLPRQPPTRRRSRTPWVLAALLLLALVAALVYEQLQINGVSLPALLTIRH